MISRMNNSLVLDLTEIIDKSKSKALFPINFRAPQRELLKRAEQAPKRALLSEVIDLDGLIVNYERARCPTMSSDLYCADLYLLSPIELIY